MTRGDLPRGVFPKGRWYYLVTAAGPKRIWTKLSMIRDGLPALYAALSKARTTATEAPRMPGLIAAWEEKVMIAHAQKTQRDERARGRVIAEAFREFAPADVDSPTCAQFLDQYRRTPRTYNAYRAALRELMRFAEERGMRHPGTNPIQSIRTMSTPARRRYITDSELRRIKVAAMRGADGLDTRSGPMLCALVDMAYLTGQAIGDLLDLDWKQVGTDGIEFRRAKVAHSTGAAVLIEWTPKLSDVVRRLKALRVERRAFGGAVFVTQDGKPYTYWGASSAWRRACARAGVADCTFHDLKAKALTDKDAKEGRGEARKMGQHSTEGQTADYIRHRKAQTTKATR
jgi:integrase